jgi:hypothetical protein
VQLCCTDGTYHIDFGQSPIEIHLEQQPASPSAINL